MSPIPIEAGHHETERPFGRSLAAVLVALLASWTVPAAEAARAGAPLVPEPTEDGAWLRIRPAPARAFHAGAYDPRRDRWLLFGGLGADGEVWSLDLATGVWQVLTARGPKPCARREHSVVFDSRNDRLVVFGGWGDHSLLDDVWAFSPADSEWTRLTPSGAGPSGRAEHVAAFDPGRSRMVVFGGFDGALRNDVWGLDLTGSTAWSEISPAGPLPSPRHSHSGSLDPVNERWIVFGGWNRGLLADAWSLSLGSEPRWEEIETGGAAPPARKDHGAVFDARTQRLIVIGGLAERPLADAWTLSLAGTPAWTRLDLPGTGPGPRRDATVLLDPIDGRLLVGGGWNEGVRGDAWALSLDAAPAWSPLLPGVFPVWAAERVGFIDPGRRRLVLASGYDLWAASLDPPYGWESLAAAGTPPPVLFEMAGVHDPIADRLVVFGGGTSWGNGTQTLWELRLAEAPSWAPILAGGETPPPRHSHSAVLDRRRHRMILFGGYHGEVSNWGSSYLGDLWSLDLDSHQWQRLEPSGTGPSRRYRHRAVYDPLEDRMLVFGGLTPFDQHGLLLTNDLWELDLERMSWRQLFPEGLAPEPRASFAMSYDATRSRALISGGQNGALWSRLSDLWWLELRPVLRWVPAIPAGPGPPPLARHLALHDSLGDQAAVFGSDGDLWLLQAAPRSPRRAHPAAGLSVSAAAPNPATSATAVRLVLPTAARVGVRIHDVHGRLIRSIPDRAYEAGSHELRWDGTADAGGRAAPGMYFILVRTPTAHHARRVVILE